VKIGLKPNGHAKYPNFNALAAVQATGMDWAKYVDIHGLSWHYDKTSGHQEDTPDSPWGQQWGVLIVPEEFASQAVAAFPDVCARLTEAGLEAFYDEKAHAHEQDERIDLPVLEGIRAKQAIGRPLTPQQEKALDPDDDTPGIRKNPKRKWQDFKRLVNVTIKEAQ
jgi:hypothetical protein